MKTRKREIVLSTEPVNGTSNCVKARLEVNILGEEGEKLGSLMDYSSVMEIDWEDSDMKYKWINREDGLVFEGIVLAILKIIGQDSGELYAMIEEIWETKKPMFLEETFTAEIYR